MSEKLEDIHLELPAAEKFVYENKGFLFAGKRCKLTGDTQKYIVHVKREGEIIGKFTFFVSDRMYPEIIFEGMYIEGIYRNNGISNTFMEELFRIAIATKREFTHSVPQRKPIMCRVLDKWGFSPLQEDPGKEQDVVYVARGINGMIQVCFLSLAKERNFCDSKIFRSQPYEIVKDVTSMRNVVHCVLNTPYLRIE